MKMCVCSIFYLEAHKYLILNRIYHFLAITQHSHSCVHNSVNNNKWVITVCVHIKWWHLNGFFSLWFVYIKLLQKITCRVLYWNFEILGIWNYFWTIFREMEQDWLVSMVDLLQMKTSNRNTLDLVYFQWYEWNIFVYIVYTLSYHREKTA